MSGFIHDGISGRQLAWIDNDELFSAETGQKFATVRDRELYLLDGEKLQSIGAVGAETPDAFLRLLGTTSVP